jgi:hypothetical protein
MLTIDENMMTEPWQRLPALSLKQIQYFVTLAQLRHFTDTANRLAISQPALAARCGKSRRCSAASWSTAPPRR